ncbi:MAG: hypothetical protein CMB56_004080 [Methanobacteriota archaeon]|nr:MAG: hypothetical protein CMB56_004080 [Euryarchaeota archaeon]|tara:strand:- start:7181 stop:7435 length:255 start_codon:yes stop_codon:yes gene_type:complete
MSYHPKQYVVDASIIVKGLFDESSLECSLLKKAACGEIRLISNPKEWNKILWLLVNTFKNSDGKSIFTGEKLGEIKKALPIEFR